MSERINNQHAISWRARRWISWKRRGHEVGCFHCWVKLWRSRVIFCIYIVTLISLFSVNKLCTSQFRRFLTYFLPKHAESHRDFNTEHRAPWGMVLKRTFPTSDLTGGCTLMHLQDMSENMFLMVILNCNTEFHKGLFLDPCFPHCIQLI